MTPQERDLIMGLFDRMRSYGTVDKEREADALISQQVRQLPDSAYLLVQSVLVQDQALAAANDRVHQLEAQVRELEAGRGQGQPSSSGSFLGGIMGGRAAQASVPASRPSVSPGGPWGQPAQPQAYQPQPQYAQPAQQAPMAAPARPGGGFLRQAMGTAAGIAGGMILADSIRNMLGGHHGGLGGMPPLSPGYDQAALDHAQDEGQDLQMAADDAQADANQDASQDASDTSSSSDSGSDSTDV